MRICREIVRESEVHYRLMDVGIWVPNRLSNRSPRILTRLQQFLVQSIEGELSHNMSQESSQTHSPITQYSRCHTSRPDQYIPTFHCQVRPHRSDTNMRSNELLCADTTSWYHVLVTFQESAPTDGWLLHNESHHPSTSTCHNHVSAPIHIIQPISMNTQS